MYFNKLYVDQVDSTNLEAMRLIREVAVTIPAVIVAGEQLSGRGHGNSSWESEAKKNLCLSLIIKPEFIKASEQFLLTKITSLAVMKLVSKYIPAESIRIKWPNDLYAGDKKMAGMLIQNVVKGHLLDHCIIGVGLNVNQQTFVSDAPNPVSIIHYHAEELNLESLLDEFLHIFSYYYDAAHSKMMQQRLHDAYLKALYRYNEWSDFEKEGSVFRGLITDVDPFGQLLVQLKDGSQRKYGFKEITFVL